MNHVANLFTGEIGHYEGVRLIHSRFHPAPWAVEAAAMLMPHYRAALTKATQQDSTPAGSRTA